MGVVSRNPRPDAPDGVGETEAPPMPSLPHEALLELFRRRPPLAAELLRDALHAPIPAFDRVRIGDSNLTELSPAELRADLVLLLEGSNSESTTGAIVVEAQLGTDTDKRWSWPAYLCGLRARLHCAAALVVVTGDRSVARWAARPIETGHPGFTLTPLVLGPASVPVVLDSAVAAQSPELAVLSAIVHGEEPEAVGVARAAAVAALSLDDERAALYLDVILASVNQTARAVLEALMANRPYEYQSDFAKRYVAVGKAQGQAEAAARAVLRVLEARGVDVPGDVRERILACADLALLDAWLERAVTATSASEVFGQ